MIGKQVIKKCSQCDCGEQRLIVNKRHNLCHEKNRLRIDDNSGSVRANVKKLQAKKLLSNRTSSKLSLSKNKISVNLSYKEACQQILDQRGDQCQGCGTHQRLSFSHLVPRSRRPDLIDNPLNIHIHCMDGDGIVGCHTLYEAGRWTNLNDHDTIIQSLQQLDYQYYQLKISKQ